MGQFYKQNTNMNLFQNNLSTWISFDRSKLHI